MAMNFLAIPAVKGCHNGLRTRMEASHIALSMFLKQSALVHLGITLVNAVCGAAIANKVLHGANYPFFTEKVVVHMPLQATHNSGCVIAHNCWIFRVTFVGSAPAQVFGDRYRGGKHPVDPGNHYFTRGNRCNLFY